MTNSNTSHTQKILLTTLTILFLTGFSAAASDGSISELNSGPSFVAPGDSNVEVQAFTVSDSGGDSSPLEIDSFSVGNADGSATDADISSIAIYAEEGTSTGFQSSEDTQVGTETVSSFGTAIGDTDSDTTIPVTSVSNTGSQKFYAVVSFASGATDGNTVEVETTATTTSDSTSTFTGTSGDSATTSTNGQITTIDTAPTIQSASITSTSSSGSDQQYIGGETITVNVTYDEAVSVSSTPSIDLTAVSADYSKGSGTKELQFSYTVQSGDSGSISLNGITGTITDNDEAAYSAETSTSDQSLTTASIDTTAPSSPTLTPTDDSIGVSVGSDLTLDFGETVEAGTGNVVIKKQSDDSTVATIDVTGGQVTFGGDQTVTVNPSSDLSSATDYYVQVDSGAIQDTAGNDWAGISDKTSWSFTTAASDTVTLHDSAQGSEITTVKEGEKVYVKATDGATTGGTKTATISDLGASDSITVTLYDDGNNADSGSGSGDGNYWGSFTVQKGTSSTDDSNDVIDVADTNSVEASADLDSSGTPGTATVTADFTAPSPSINSVSDQIVKSGTSIDVTYDASASDIQSVTVAITDGTGDVVTTTGSTDTGVTTSINAPSTTGSYNIEVRATDDAGNVGTSSQKSLTVDDTSPTATFTSVDDGAIQSGDTVTVTYELSDNNNLQSGAVQIKNSTDVVVEKTLSSLTTDGTSSTVDLTVPSSTSEGDYDVVVKGTDEADNSGSDTGSGAVTVDETKPSEVSVELVEDGDGYVADGDTVTVNVNVSDDVSSATDISVSGNAGAFNPNSGLTLSGGIENDYTGSFTVGTPGDGEASVSVTATDEAGNQNSTSESLTVDNTDPSYTSTSVVITEDQNSNGVLNEGDKFNVTADVSDATSSVNSVTADVSALNSNAGSTASLSNSDGSLYWKEFTVGTNSNLDQNGLSGETNHSVTVTATDSAGNSKDDSSASVAVDTTTPSATVDTLSRVSNGIDLTWSRSTDSDAVRYNLYRKNTTGSGSYELVKSDAGPSFTDTSVEDGVTYKYSVEIVDDGGNKANTTSSSITADLKPPVLTNVQVTQDGADEIINADDTVKVSADITDSPAGVKNNVTVNASVLGGSETVSLTASGDTYSGTFTVGTPSAEDGDVSLTITAYDNLDHKSTSSDSVSLDTTKATVQSVETVDLGTDGDIDSVKVTYSEDVKNVGTDDVDLTSSSNTPSDAKEISPGVVRYNLSSDIAGTAANPQVSFTTSNIQDVAGNNLASGQDTSATDAANPVIDLNKGLNLVSFPISSTDTQAVSDVLDESKTNEVWKYVDGEWKVWTPEKADNSGFSFDIRSGEGYIVNSSQSYTSTPEIDELQSTAPRQVDLVEGWNLVGHYDESSESISTALDNTIGSSSYNQVWKNTGTGSINYADTDDTFQPGQAYWVQTKGDLSDGTVVYGAN